MANYPLALTASEIDAALTKAHAPDTTLTGTLGSDPSLVTAGAVKSAIDGIASSNILTTDSFAPAALETSTDELTDTDDAIPTSAAVLAGNKFSLKAGFTLLHEKTYASVTGTAPSSGFLVMEIQFRPNSNAQSAFNVIIGPSASTQVTFAFKEIQENYGGSAHTKTYTLPIAHNENYEISSANIAVYKTVYFKSFQT